MTHCTQIRDFTKLWSFNQHGVFIRIVIPGGISSVTTWYLGQKSHKNVNGLLAHVLLIRYPRFIASRARIKTNTSRVSALRQAMDHAALSLWIKKDDKNNQKHLDECEIKSNSCEAELRFRAIFEQAPYGIVIIDTDGKLLEFNEAAHRDLGYSREEFAKISLSDIDPYETPEEIQASMKKVLEAGEAEFEVKHRTKAGYIRDVILLPRVVNLSGSRVFQAIWHDITERKQAERTLSNIVNIWSKWYRNAQPNLKKSILSFNMISPCASCWAGEGKSYQRTSGRHVQVKNMSGCFLRVPGAGKCAMTTDTGKKWRPISKNIQMLPSPTAYVLNACRKMTRNHIKEFYDSNKEFGLSWVPGTALTGLPCFLPSVISVSKGNHMPSGTIE